MSFRALHQCEEPLLLCNVWDVPSALIAEQRGFKAIGTSSAAIARMLGKEDGEQIPFNDLVAIVGSISESSKLPLTVDIEFGYGDTPEQVTENIIKLVLNGAVGVNIEDSIVIHDDRFLLAKDLFANKLKAIKKLLIASGVDIFINVRTDTYLLDAANALEESIERIEMYQESGANGVFLPCLKIPHEIKAIVNSTTLPINVMCVPDLPDFNTLKELGVKRISMGNFVHSAMLDSLSATLDVILKKNSFGHLFNS